MNEEPKTFWQWLLATEIPKRCIEQMIRGESMIRARYTDWQIGITSRPPERRKREHEAKGRDCSDWMQLSMKSFSAAREVERYFIHERRMRGNTGGRKCTGTPYVYLFRNPGKP